MSKQVTLTVNGNRIQADEGTVLAAVLERAGVIQFRRSVSGEGRGPLCGMGICFECCVTVNGEGHRRSCVSMCEDGMEVQTDE